MVMTGKCSLERMERIRQMLEDGTTDEELFSKNS